MSIRINNKIISGTYTAQSYRYVGEIFQSALPIEDSRVALLDGHKIYESEGYGSFIQYITSLALLYPQLSCTEDEWQLSDTTYGECGKFVIGEDGVRLPKIVSFVQGLSSLQDLATLVEAGLPNITGNTIVKALSDRGNTIVNTPSGAFEEDGTYCYINGGSNYTFQCRAGNMDASRCSSVYGNSTTVQPQSIRYPYYIVLATGVTQEVKVKEELTTNIPFTLFESKYSEVELNNTSWLLSSGQWNSKELYPSAYNELVKEYNAGSNKYSIKLHADEYGDYDFVLNLDDETFRLPLKSKLASGKAVVGNGMSLGFTDGASLSRAIDNSGQIMELGASYGKQSGELAQSNVSISTSAKSYEALGITTDPTKSGIETSDSDLYLYFYVGDTNINVSLVDTGKLTQEVANLIPNNSSLISGYAMPSDKCINLTLGASNTTYTAPANGWLNLLAENTTTSSAIGFYANGINLSNYTSSPIGNHISLLMPVKKGDVVTVAYSNIKALVFRFNYAEGEK